MSCSRKHRRGAIVSMEMILVIGVIVALAVLALMGVGKDIMAQATSTKANLVVSNPQGWYYATPASGSQAYVFVQFSATNMGDRPVTITKVTLLLDGTNVKYTADVGKLVKPGETVVITVKLEKVGVGTPVFGKTETLVVEYVDESGRLGQVILPIVLSEA